MIDLRIYWLPPVLLLFLGTLALIVLSGSMDGVDSLLKGDIFGVVFWLLLFSLFAQNAANLWDSDIEDGTFDQKFLTAQRSYLTIILSQGVQDIFAFILPLSIVFAGIWTVGVGGAFPLLSLLGLLIPITVIRLMASALSLSSRGKFGAGSLFFISLSALFFFLAVADRADLIWSFGLIFSPACLVLLPFTLSTSHQSR